MGTLTNRVKILSGFALTTFANLVYANRSRLRRMWILSPWLSAENSGTDPISLLVESLRGSKCNVNLVTRKPEAIWHSDALKVFTANFKPTVYFCATLHTKLYLLECDGFHCAILGSPNLTTRGDKANHELAIELRTTMSSCEDDVASLINSLIEYAQNLTAEDNVTLAN